MGPSDDDDVPRINTELQILKFMSDYDIPLQPRQIFGGMIVKEDVTFSYGTLQNKLSDLVEAGDLDRVKIDRDGSVDVMDDNEGGRANYLITERGKERIEREYP
ncbi:hypothetical protein GOC74_12300 [Halomicrobium mukohataei]|uniref:PadR family transcriptional regulator n=1 Tax=Halomicrobium mukohataei TaxID=57705 RepID=A0A847UBB9_9EURY|nr:hypothetical protein [Halomicrobium mukohataei]NLV10705.1 hypothetical protein [Halomicrobium mukohataei]